MGHLAKRISLVLTALIISVFSVNVLTVMDVAAANAPANNGTLKVHEVGTPSDTESNDPKVCIFNFEGFGFDAAQSGYVTIDTQGGGPNSTTVLTMPFGPTDVDGYAISADINDGISGYAVANGLYNSTLYGKQTGNPALPDLTDEKAKSKVFTVTCEDTAPLTVVPATPTHVDACGTDDDSYTIVATNGVTYYVGNDVVATGSHVESGTVIVYALANDGYTFGDAEYSWTFEFDDGACDILIVPTPPTFKEVCGTKKDVYTIPVQRGVTYYIDQIVADPGTNNGSGTVTVVARANDGYTFGDAEYSWTFTFSTEKCEKVVICHQTGDYNNPYVKKKVNSKSVDGKGKKDHYNKDQGPVFNPTLPFDTQWGDIIPKTETRPDGLNWNSEGKPIYRNDCVVVPVEVESAEPTFNDECSVDGDTYTIPTTAGVTYYVGELARSAGTYEADGTVTIQAVANPGYVINKDVPMQWTHEFTDEACPQLIITATVACTATLGIEVTLQNDGDGDGYAYVNGVEIAIPAMTSVVVAVPVIAFKADIIVMTADETTILQQSIECTPGKGSVAPPVVTPQSELPMTGPRSFLSQLLTLILLAGATYGLTFYLQGRRDLRKQN